MLTEPQSHSNGTYRSGTCDRLREATHVNPMANQNRVNHARATKQPFQKDADSAGVETVKGAHGRRAQHKPGHHVSPQRRTRLDLLE
jgi:hypothetical protein